MSSSSGQTSFDPQKSLPAEFELLEKLGEGAHGQVYKAILRTIDSTVAVKFIHQELLDKEKATKQFLQEAKVIASLNHPNIVKVLQVGIGKDDTPYLVYEYLEGETLETILEREQTLSARFLGSLFEQLCSALEQAHSQGLIHRDLKPANIMILREQSDPTVFIAKLLDFGIAKRLTPELDANQTKTTAQAGSPGYMSPEQCNSTELSPRSDIYSMSCLLYQCLIGKLPFEGESPTHTMYLHATQAPALPNPTLTASMNRLLSQCLAKDPMDRPAKVEEFQLKLNSALKELEKHKTNRLGNKLQLALVLVAIAAILPFVFNSIPKGILSQHSQQKPPTKPVMDELMAIRNLVYFPGNESTISRETQAINKANLLLPRLDRRRDLLIAAYALKAEAQNTIGQYQESIQSWLTAIELCKKQKKGPLSQAAYCQIQMAESMLEMRKADQAIACATLGLNQFRSAQKENFAYDINIPKELTVFQCISVAAEGDLTLAKAYFAKNDLAKAHHWAKLALEESKGIAYDCTGSSYRTLAEIEIKQNKKEQAWSELKQWLDELERNDTRLRNADMHAIVQSFQNMADWFDRHGDTKEAIRVLKRGIKIGDAAITAKTEDNPELMQQTMDGMRRLLTQFEQKQAP